MDDRLPNCPDHTCRCLTSYGGRICFGRLAAPQPDGPLWNTHRRCETEDGYQESVGQASVAQASPPADPADPVEFNLADAYYEVSGFALAIREVLDQGLYNPGPDLGLTDPVTRLVSKLEGK